MIDAAKRPDDDQSAHWRRGGCCTILGLSGLLDYGAKRHVE